MRTDRTTQDDKLFTASGAARWLRVDVKDTGGTFRDLTAQRNYNFVERATYRFDQDTPIATATVNVKREIFKASLAPDVLASVLNQLGGGSQLILPNVRIRLYSQIQPSGVKPDASAWRLVFDGVIDQPDSGHDPMALECSDLSVQLDRCFIKTERIYGVWDAARRLISGTVVVATAAATNGANNMDAPTGPWWQAQSTFTTGATEPVWPASPTPGTTTVSDNGGTWKCIAGPTGTPLETHIQQLLDDNMGVGAWTLYVPGGSTGEVIKPYIQKGASLLQTLQKVADIIAFDVRYRYIDNPGQTPPGSSPTWAAPPGGVAGFYLTLYDPIRANATSAYTITPKVYDPIDSLTRNILGTRNDIDGFFWNGSSVDASGNPIMSKVNSTDAASVAANGDLYAAFSEGTSEMVNTAAAMQKMTDGALSDLSTPMIDLSVTTDFAWWFEPTDLITVAADGLHFDADQKLAIYSLEHTIDQGSARSTTKFGLRGKPCSGYWRWHEKFAQPGMNGGSTKSANPYKALAATISATIAGGLLKTQFPSPKLKRYDYTEVHVSASNGFTPSSSTLYASGRSTTWSLDTLPNGTAFTPGTTYYVLVIHRDVNGNPGATSSQMSFVPAYVTPAVISTTLRQAFKYRLALPETAWPNDTIPFGSAIYDTQSVVTSGGKIFTPLATIPGRMQAQVQFRGSAIALGWKAQLMIWDNTSNAAGFVGQWFFAGTSGDALSQPEIMAVLDTTFVFLTGHAYSIKANIVDQDGNVKSATNVMMAGERIAIPQSRVNGMTLHAGDTYRPATPNGRAYYCSVGGVASGSLPAFATTDYGTFADGSATMIEDGSDTQFRSGSFWEFIPFPT